MTTIDNIRELQPSTHPCPAWCTDHRGELAPVATPLPEGVAANELVTPVGEHRAQIVTGVTADEDDPRGVYLSQAVSAAGVWSMSIYIRDGFHAHGSARVISLTSQEARGIGRALLEAADIAESAMSGRCRECGSAINSDRQTCERCDLLTNKRRRAIISAVD